ncbi:hypothetical protein M758_UG216100 [Ceratodon purpureus]|uniref:Uncharacterized protein n=1 Tax=Ceratodon purpureus TaxID=3225 RepID=A0A8T0GLD5_CERPU|nr:hypothetical protein KC19_10G130100 [Ceratodon purpureus]KAG0596009.1 hypothetical protein M758_UG216100 [Ceratodon purpureus]
MANDVVYYRNASLSEINMFYREAGDPSHPTILLLHGFPTSSHMFRGLIPLLACFLHVESKNTNTLNRTVKNKFTKRKLNLDI